MAFLATVDRLSILEQYSGRGLSPSDVLVSRLSASLLSVEMVTERLDCAGSCIVALCMFATRACRCPNMSSCGNLPEAKSVAGSPALYV